ncbi:DNA topoisomerase 2 [Acorus calamus]|uniref:DNA topoisomerase 2 n=1 Tax=Acorus calamus TaxID=4465 RepID=A0AAV9E067_ACOCL|nr:DNA topoisomerase 2 [Acorus calamus]
MAVEKKLPLQSSSSYNSGGGGAVTAAGKTIEETYQKKTQLEHILLRPDTYIGSVDRHTQTLWVYDNNGEMVHRPVTYVPGLYKIFDEILVNAADNKQRDPSMDAVRVTIDVEGNSISVYNNGDGVPVEVHKEEGVYVPELIFGHLLTSSNYDDNEKKTTGGRNGYGAKLANIFSTEFVIETADGKRLKKYKQVFTNNMGNKTSPIISKCKEGDNWTKVTFKPDLAKFKMTHLEDDVVALMKKRVVDIAGCLGKTVKVELNGQRLPVKSFSDYVNFYLQSANKSRPDQPLPRIAERVNDRWEICVSLSDGQFQQVSFVNSIATIKGGSHVDYVTNQITSHVIGIVNKKNKNANMKAHTVKNHLWVFVNALIDNPAFDSQTKETLTTRQGSFGTKCELSQEFLKKVAKSGVVDSLLSWADFKQSKDLKKTDGTKRQRITGITKLEDANEAGGRNSEKCTLILTEGDSAKALAMAGISVVGRNHYGVFPLRGKLLNVREASHKQIMDNAEIQNIKVILGLQHGKQYDSVKSLRYGHLMIMTDQDHDGSHIKGLLINFIHSFWPSLLKVPSFMVEFITPIVKGLGTSTSKEGKEYFSDLDKHKKDFVWADDNDGDAIEMAFSKKKIEARKNWLRHFEPGTYLDQKEKLIKYSDFVNKELILFSLADLQRSIPSMVDGLKPGQRKILFCSFKRNFVKEAKVAQFSGYVSEHSAYHHGEQSLASTIIGMAQDFVGSNNINLLQPNGQFGTRNQGGKDHASARYIYTCLSPLTRFLFPKDDDILLDYLNEDGQSIEPTWYMPIIPMVLVNGSEGIGTGWSSYIPNYNPRDIVANLKRLLNDEPMHPMDPWYKGFKGLIEKSVTKDTGVTYTISGIIEEVDETTLRVTELPIRRWTQDYKEFLEALMTGTDKIKEPFIKDYREHNDDVSVHFDVILSEENMNIARQEGLMKKFKLTTTISTSNMHLFDSNGVIKKYDTPDQIQSIDTAVAGATVEVSGGNEEEMEVVKGGVKASDYEYLLSMSIGTLTLEKVQELCAEKNKLENEVDELRKATPKSLWDKDLDSFVKELDEQEKTEAQAEVVRKAMRKKEGSTATAKPVAARKPRKNSNAGNPEEEGKPKAKGRAKKAPAKATVVDSDDEDDEVLELKDRLAAYNIDDSPPSDLTSMETEVPKKAPSKRATKAKQPIMEISDDNDDESMQTIPEEDDDEFAPPLEPAPKGRGRKPAASKATTKATTAAARKRGKPILGQKLITEVLKPVEGNVASPEKKVRKMRASPFNKKSGSILGRQVSSSSMMEGEETTSGGSGASSSSSALPEEERVVAVRARPQRANQRRTTYVISDSEGEEEVESEDSDFSEGGDSE